MLAPMSSPTSKFPSDLRRPELILFATGFALVLALFLFRAWMFWALTVDDAYITMRQARNLVNGHGFVYNIGGPVVESYTNHSMFLVQALLIALGLDVVFCTKLIGVLCGLAAVSGSVVLASYFFRLRATPPAHLLWLLPGAWILADSPILATGSVAGLETSLFTALTTWSTILVFKVTFLPHSRRHVVTAALLFGFMVWTRPEGIAWALGLATVTALLACRDRPTLRSVFAIGATALGFWLALTLYRVAVFGHPLPNSYYVKMSGETISRAISGLKYLRDWLTFSRGWVLLLLASLPTVLLSGRARACATIALAAVCGHLAITVYEGGDWMPHLRFIAPCLGVLASLVSMGLAATALRFFPARERILALVVPVAFCILWSAALQPDLKRALGEVQVRVYGWKDGQEAMAKWIAGWEHSRESADRQPLTVAIEDIGLVGYYSDVRIIDLAGLADPEWAQIAYKTGRVFDYPAGPLVMDKHPDIIVLVTQTPPSAPQTRMDWHTNRAVFQHPDFPKSYQYLATYTHKDFPGDGYFLNVYLRADEFNEPPRPIVPVGRARNTR